MDKVLNGKSSETVQIVPKSSVDYDQEITYMQFGRGSDSHPTHLVVYGKRIHRQLS